MENEITEDIDIDDELSPEERDFFENGSDRAYGDSFGDWFSKG